MEAEVRLYGSLYLASAFSLLLGLLSLAAYRWGETAWTVNLVWIGVSLIAFFILGEGFIKNRIREVGYTYINALLIHGHLQTESLLET